MDGESDGDDAVNDEDTVEDQAGPEERNWAPLALMIGLGLVMLLLIGGLVWQTTKASDLEAEKDARRAVARTAGEFATEVYAYNYEDLRGSLEEILALSTDDYALEFEENWNNEVEPVISELRGKGEVVINDVYVTDIDGKRAKAVVSLNAVLRSSVGARRLTGTFLEMRLKKEDGRWLVNDYVLLATTNEAFDPAGGGGGGGGGSTTTTAPTATTATTATTAPPG